MSYLVRQSKGKKVDLSPHNNIRILVHFRYIDTGMYIYSTYSKPLAHTIGIHLLPFSTYSNGIFAEKGIKVEKISSTAPRGVPLIFLFFFKKCFILHYKGEGVQLTSPQETWLRINCLS